MMFDSYDLQVLSRVIMRKGCETAKVTIDPKLSDYERYRWVDEIVQQIARARIMVCLGRNEFSNLEAQLSVLKDGVVFMPNWMFEIYVSDLSERDLSDEKHFILLCGQLIRQSLFLKLSMQLADQGLASDLSLKGIDQLQLHRLRMLILHIRCTIQEIEEDSSELLEHLSTVESIVSVLMRIINGKAVSSIELSLSAKKLDTLDWTVFDKENPYPLTQDESKIIDYFRENCGKYLIAMYARCILNYRYPESCIIRDVPAF